MRATSSPGGLGDPRGGEVDLSFLYRTGFGPDLPDAYERLVLDVLLGDPTLFMRADEIEEQWALVEPILAAWLRERVVFPNHPAGSWGPGAADRLLRRDGRKWHSPRWPVPSAADEPHGRTARLRQRPRATGGA